MFVSGHQMDAKSNRIICNPGLPRVERSLWWERPALLLPSKCLPINNPGITWRDPSSFHLHGVPQQLSLAAGPDRRWFLCQEMSEAFVKDRSIDPPRTPSAHIFQHSPSVASFIAKHQTPVNHFYFTLEKSRKKRILKWNYNFLQLFRFCLFFSFNYFSSYGGIK